MVRGVVIGIAAYVGADLLGNLLGHGIGMLVMLGGLAAVLYQAYFLAITVERPVRMTPGRAVSDYLDALSHLMPHYKRMWLLLSNEGRDSVSSGDYERFVGYWQAHLGRLRGEQVPRWVPLHFEAGEIKCTKDRENSAARAKFQLQVFAASPRRSEPLDAWQVEVGLIKGRDGMWYLRRGDLLGAPGEPQEAGRAGGGDDEDVE